MDIFNSIKGLFTATTKKVKENKVRKEKRKQIENLPKHLWHPELITIYKKFTYSKIKKMYDDTGCFFETKVMHINIFGIRNKKRKLFDDKMCDILGVCWIDNKGNKRIARYQGTTRPGKYYVSVRHRLNKLGAAIMILGPHNQIWQIGTHRKKWYPCLIQTGGPVTVARDFNINGLIDDNDLRKTGWWGINFHMGWFGQNKIGRSSAGCMVIASIPEHKKIMKIIMSDIRYKQNNKFRYNFSLLIY